MKRATINDVALTAGVSTFTASRALRGKDHVAAATRDKVLKAAKELNYTASRSAAALASGRTNRIAMLARERLAGWFMGELFDGLYDELSRARYDLTVYRAGSVEERAEFFTRLPANRNADALIVSGFSATDEEADTLASMGMPKPPSVFRRGGLFPYRLFPHWPTGRAGLDRHRYSRMRVVQGLPLNQIQCLARGNLSDFARGSWHHGA